MIAVTGGEPMVQHGFLARWLESHSPPVDCLLETNALLIPDLDRILPHVRVVSADVKLPSTTGEQAYWDHHRRFLEHCRDTEVYVKMPVDDATDIEEVRRGARLVADTLPSATLFLQPATDVVTGSWNVGTPQLLRFLSCAAAELPSTRLRPQLHKMVGVR
jgi:organic radical activating enzyme